MYNNRLVVLPIDCNINGGCDQMLLFLFIIYTAQQAGICSTSNLDQQKLLADLRQTVIPCC